MNSKIVIAILLVFFSCSTGSEEDKKAETSDINQEAWIAWKADRLNALNDKDGWNNLIGLHWLDVGETIFESGTNNSFDLKSNVSYRARFLRGLNDEVYLTLENGKKLLLQDTLIFDTNAHVAEIGFDKTSFHLIKRSDQIGIRIREYDHFSDIREIPSFEYEPNWEIEADFKTHSVNKIIPFQNVLGMTIEYDSPGFISFDKDGQQFKLDVIESGDDHFVIFADETSGSSTYGAGRYLYVPKNQTVPFTIDFNRAQNPPCAFTEFATCLLPPKQNLLTIAVTAGEKDYHH